MGASCCSKDEHRDGLNANVIQQDYSNNEETGFHYYIPVQTLANHVKNISIHSSKATGKVRSKENVQVSPTKKPNDFLTLETLAVGTSRESAVTLLTLEPSFINKTQSMNRNEQRTISTSQKQYKHARTNKDTNIGKANSRPFRKNT